MCPEPPPVKKGTLALSLRPPPSPPPAASHLGWRITECRSTESILFRSPLPPPFVPHTRVKLLHSLFVTPNHRSSNVGYHNHRKPQVAGRISPTATASGRRGCKLVRQGHSHSHACQASTIPSYTPIAASHRVSQLPSRPPSTARPTDSSASPRRHLRPGDNPLDFVPGTVPRQWASLASCTSTEYKYFVLPSTYLPNTLSYRASTIPDDGRAETCLHKESGHTLEDFDSLTGAVPGLPPPLPKCCYPHTFTFRTILLYFPNLRQPWNSVYCDTTTTAATGQA